jgi:biotin operon repressor
MTIRVLLADDQELANTEIAELVGCSRQTVVTWAQTLCRQWPGGVV